MTAFRILTREEVLKELESLSACAQAGLTVIPSVLGVAANSALHYLAALPPADAPREET